MSLISASTATWCSPSLSNTSNDPPGPKKQVNECRLEVSVHFLHLSCPSPVIGMWAWCNFLSGNLIPPPICCTAPSPRALAPIAPVLPITHPSPSTGMWVLPPPLLLPSVPRCSLFASHLPPLTSHSPPLVSHPPPLALHPLPSIYDDTGRRTTRTAEEGSGQGHRTTTAMSENENGDGNKQGRQRRRTRTMANEDDGEQGQQRQTRTANKDGGDGQGQRTRTATNNEDSERRQWRRTRMAADNDSGQGKLTVMNDGGGGRQPALSPLPLPLPTILAFTPPLAPCPAPCPSPALRLLLSTCLLLSTHHLQLKHKGEHEEGGAQAHEELHEHPKGPTSDKGGEQAEEGAEGAPMSTVGGGGAPRTEEAAEEADRQGGPYPSP
ncbi:unnamed protein product [Cyclocybe aegerita]|uniref:Uncharacterized protein n=1 Tax=Cyclocybe aegerita TaxID=1973307 RepID=A0A8S0WWN0_CYCAE|nr:unnamed protein product [Cyclocybe aegerita]